MAVAVPGDETSSTIRSGGAMGASRSAVPRLHWVDWLRVAAIAGVFVFHTFRPFDSTGWHVKNAETSDLIGGVQIFFSSFGLAVLFLLAGIGVRFALRKRTWRRFLGERVARLLVPFIVGTLLLSPIQAFIQATHEGAGAGTAPDLVGWWWDAGGTVVSRGIDPAVFGLGYHLWFLGFLFAFSVIGLPVFAVLRSPRGSEAIAAAARRVAALPRSTVAFAVPVTVMLLLGAIPGVEEHGWHEFAQYFAYFVIGFVFASDERFLPAVRRDRAVALAVAILTTAGLVALDFGGWLADASSRGLDLRSLALATLFAVEGWASTLVILDIAMRLRSVQRPVDPRLGDAVLPFYVIHQPVILAVAFFVVQWPLAILPKWAVVFGLSLALTLVLVRLGLRVPATRFLLGARAAASATDGARVEMPVAGAHA